MSLYSERLAHLKKELAQEIIKRRRKKKKFTHNQRVMIDFINGSTKEARFIIKEMSVILKKGDDKKGKGQFSGYILFYRINGSETISV